MVIYYQGSGLIAVAALMLNFILLFAGMAGLKSTLTMPGIAGIVLTVGMAVDTNVLIFERIREEMRHGKSIRAAIELGYKNAFRTILDAHVTTLALGAVPVPVRDRADQGLRGDAGARADREPVHRGVLHADDLRHHHPSPDAQPAVDLSRETTGP